MEVKETLEQVVSKINLDSLPRDPEKAGKAVVGHLSKVYPKHNVMIVYPPHSQSFDRGCLHSHIEVKPFSNCTRRYEIYVFKRGHFKLLGDGGYINWCFSGNFKRDGKSVEFFDP